MSTEDTADLTGIPYKISRAVKNKIKDLKHYKKEERLFTPELESPRAGQRLPQP